MDNLPQTELTVTEKAAQELLYNMMKENSPKLLQFFMSCISREMVASNSTHLSLSCDITVESKRYRIETKSELTEINEFGKRDTPSE